MKIGKNKEKRTRGRRKKKLQKISRGRKGRQKGNKKIVSWRSVEIKERRINENGWGSNHHNSEDKFDFEILKRLRKKKLAQRNETRKKEKNLCALERRKGCKKNESMRKKRMGKLKEGKEEEI